MARLGKHREKGQYSERPLPEEMNEICSNCGFTYGSHSGFSHYSQLYKFTIPFNYCPGHEHRMDWNKGPGTIFKPSGQYKENNHVPRESKAAETAS